MKIGARTSWLSLGSIHPVRLNFRTGERIVSDEAEWLIPEKIFYFPSGYLFNAELRGKGFLALGKKGGSPEVGTSVSGKEFHAKHKTVAARGLGRLPMSQFFSSSPVSVGKIRKELKKMDRKALISLVVQLMVLNPKMLKHARISPLVLINPRLELNTLALSHGGEIVTGTDRRGQPKDEIPPN